MSGGGGGGEGGRETQQPPGVCVPMGKAVCNKTHNRAKEEEAVVKSFFSVLSRWAVCCLAAVPSVTITTPRYYRPPASQPGWYSGGRGIKLSARIKCVAPPPTCSQSDIMRMFPLDIQSWFFFSVLGVAGIGDGATTHPEELSSVSAPRLLLLLPVCVFFKRLFPPPRRASCYIRLCDRLPSLSALVSRRSHPGRFDGWRLNDPQEVVSAFTLPLAVPNVSVWQQV